MYIAYYLCTITNINIRIITNEKVFETIFTRISCIILQTIIRKYNFTELVIYLETTTKKYGSLTRLILGTDVYIILAKPEDYKVSS